VITTISAVTPRPTRAHQNSAPEVNATSVVVRKAVSKPPNSTRFTMAMAPTESTPVAMRPL
jgi:hypothetical protein